MRLLIVLTCTFLPCYGDVIRTVFCKNQCTDYIGIPENSMPLCAPEHLKMKECGTVITCDWSEAERDKVRPVANATSDILCCYRTTIKEKGDCGDPNAIDAAVQTEPLQVPIAAADVCTIHYLPWLLCIFLLIVVALQAVYIVKLSISGPSHQKVSQSEEQNFPQSVITQPLVDTRLLGTITTAE
ncbi:hypothetical protein OESDEN_06320 [Oesophagostomum dentatum]|uniref:Uncharacterized protein n=1 Tax=Oesophagostomum dentatum TaxID=61180 RepID=A0A0B1TEF6_OESDE|nr:hypothetical protein OESDEN_06320 [Oesophagostomum dentatum]